MEITALGNVDSFTMAKLLLWGHASPRAGIKKEIVKIVLEAHNSTRTVICDNMLLEYKGYSYRLKLSQSLRIIPLLQHKYEDNAKYSRCFAAL